jgi:hypothetical protein
LSFLIEDTFSEDKNASLRQIIRAHRSFHGSPRYDWFLIYDPEQRQDCYGIDCYKIGQALLFLETNQDKKKYYLAYVNWFARRKNVDHETGMHIVERTKKFNVIDISEIMRLVHLQPLFEERDAAIKARSKNWNVYSFDKYLVNKYSDRAIWEILY